MIHWHGLVIRALDYRFMSSQLKSTSKHDGRILSIYCSESDEISSRNTLSYGS